MPYHRSEEHTSELQSHDNLVCRLLLEKKNKHNKTTPLSTYSSSPTPHRPDQHRPQLCPAGYACVAVVRADVCCLSCLFFFFLNNPAPPEFPPFPPPAPFPT